MDSGQAAHQQRSASGMLDDEGMQPPSPTTHMGLAHDKAAALFRSYDLMSRGWLSRSQMVAALSELSVMHGLGEKGLNQVSSFHPSALTSRTSIVQGCQFQQCSNQASCNLMSRHASSVMQVIGQDPQTKRDARYSLQDFMVMYERIGLYQVG
jgi:hypothetical protein